MTASQTLALPARAPWLNTDSLRANGPLLMCAVFALVLAVIKTNQFIYFTYATSPAVVLLPAGIGLMAVFLGGYRMALPMSAAWLIGVLTGPVSQPLLIAITAAVAYPLQASVGAYLLRRLGFRGHMGSSIDALTIVAGALVITIIAPTLLTAAQWFAGSLTAEPWFVWTRAWAGNVMSVMLFTPLLATWLTPERLRAARQYEFLENALSLTVLAGLFYFMSWTVLGRQFSYVLLYLSIAVLFWIGLRLRPRLTALALTIAAFVMVTGVLIAHPNTTTTVAQQLLNIELFMVLIAPMFYILAALVEERRVDAETAISRAKELEEANRRLSSADRSKNEFLATLAHELRNPLAPIVSSLELLRLKAEAGSRAELIKFVDVAERHSRTLARLLDDLLDISRITRKKFKLHKQPVLLGQIISQAIESVDLLYKAKNHTLIAPLIGEEVWLKGDAVRLEQVLVNLMSNAAKYTDPGGRIELGVAHTNEGVRISLKDNGKGIDSKMLLTIFEPFVQAADGTTAGLGLGLSLTKRLVELHGGRVWAESDGLGRGSTFVVALPPEALAEAPLPQVVRPKRAKDSPKSHTILVVDDNRSAADGMSLLLKHNRHSVAVAYDGASALAAMRAMPVGVVLLDIGLPDMDGYTVARQLRQEYAKASLTLIALTGYGQLEDKQKAELAGFDYHLTKPVSVKEIENVLLSVN